MQSIWSAETTETELDHLQRYIFNSTTTPNENGNSTINGCSASQASNPSSDKETFDTTVSVNFDFLPSQCPPLLPDDTQNYHEDLYSVEQDQLLPINSPFLVPGIYKKIGVSPSTSPTASQHDNIERRNVFLSEHETRGRIVSSSQFKNLYVKTQETAEAVAQPTRVIPKEQPEQYSVSNLGDNFDALAKVALDILKFSQRDHIVIDRKRNQIVRTAYETNQKTIYRFLSPETLNLTAGDQASSTPPDVKSVKSNLPIKLKLGRPRKKRSDQVDIPTIYKRPAPNNNEAKTKQNLPKNIKTVKPKLPELRTRSGRVVKLIKPSLSTNLKHIEEGMSNSPQAAAYAFRDFLADLKDTDYRCNNSVASTPAQPSLDFVPAADEMPLKENSALDRTSKRRVPPESICPTCHKIFLGRRLQRHFTLHPDHMLPNITPTTTTSSAQPPILTNDANTMPSELEQMTLFRFLTAKLQRSSHLSEDQRAEIFLSEINDLVEQLQLRSSRLIRNTSGLHLVTARTARVLGIPEGQYALDMSAIEAPPEPETTCLSLSFEQHLNGATLSTAPSTHTRGLDYATLSVSLDDTLTDEAAQKLNLSAGGKLLPPSEESLLRAVEVDLERNNLVKLGETNLLHPPSVSSVTAGATALSSLVPHYDQASDNAVEAVSMKETTATTQQTTPLLDLAVDFFQFNN